MANGTTIAKAYIQILPSMEGIKSSLAGEMKSSGSEAGNTAGTSIGKNLVSTLKKVVIAAGIGKAISSALTEGAALEQSIGGIETLFKESSDTMKEYAAQAYATAGVSANNYMEQATSFAASLISGLGGDTAAAAEYANRAIIDMADNSNKMGTDLESIQNAYQGFAKQNYTMLDNLKLGYGGTQAEMKRLIADAAELTDVQEELGVTVDANSMSFDNIVNAISVVQSEMGITGTTSLEAAETFTGSLQSMKAAAQNLLGNLALGENIGPSLEALATTTMTFVNNNLIPMVWKVLQGVPDLISGVLTSAIQEINIVSDNADNIVEQGVELISTLAESIISALPYLAEAAVNLVTSFGSALLKTDWTAIGSNLITSLKQSMNTAASTIFGTDGNILQSLLDSITAKMPTVLEKGTEIVTNLLNGILQSLPTILEQAGTVIQSLLDAWYTMRPQLWNAGMDLLLNLINGIVDNLPSIVSSAAQVIASLLATFAEHLPEMLQQGIALIGKLAAGLIQAIPTLVASIPQIIAGIVNAFAGYDWLSIGKNIMEGIKSGIVSMAASVVEGAKEVCSSLLGGVKSFFGINSPSTVMAEQGGYLTEGMVQGMQDLPTKTDGVFSSVLQRIQGFGTNASATASAAGAATSTGISSATQTLSTAIGAQYTQVETRAATFLSNMRLKATETGRTYVTTLITLMKTLPDQTWMQFSLVLNKANSFVTSFKDKASEAGQGFATVLKQALAGLPGEMQTVGNNIVQGLYKGMSSSWPWLEKQVSALAQSLLAKTKAELGIASPSKAFRDEVGRWIPAGIAEGILGNTGAVTSAVRTVANGALGSWDSLNRSMSGSTQAAYAMAGAGYGGYNQTINVYSPQELSPSEVARQTRNATKNMVLAMRRG